MITLSFGPIREFPEGWMLPYEVVREADSTWGELPVPRASRPEVCADLFLRKVARLLTNRLTIPHDTHVGAGLLSVETANRLAEERDLVAEGEYLLETLAAHARAG
jgi:hypothetical protein